MIDKLALVFNDGQYWINLCSHCYETLRKGMQPIEATANSRWIGPLPPELQDLSWIEELLIARGHITGRVIRLQNRYSSHYGLQGHVILLPQDTTRLLDLLPASLNTLKDHVRVVWSGSARPQIHEMKRFFVVRKQRVYNALRWLVEHHEDYKNVRINHDELATWDSDFQPTALMDSLIQINDTINDDISRTGLATEDLEALDGDLPLTTTAMLDVNNVSEPSVAVTIHQISDLIQKATINVVKESKIRDPKLDSSYFTSSFPTLFPYRTGKYHLSERERKIPFNT
jgi:hypothetical protein